MRYQIMAQHAEDEWRPGLNGFIADRNTLTTIRERAKIFDGARALQEGVKLAREKYGDLYKISVVFPRAIDEQES